MATSDLPLTATAQTFPAPLHHGYACLSAPSAAHVRVMLVLFCSSLLLKEHDFIPLDEAIFYFFAAVGTGSRVRRSILLLFVPLVLGCTGISFSCAS